ncbi:hypothetical protein BROUX41_001634 [Berkeleyomyces rouxiae]|uniref:uncharacterized protein n=1 Tax=Berkeleyomyces rouxiae TaxID=2035830 RepID=UPI003B7A33A1
MLLLLQSGSVKLGEVVRYTVTYTPSQDRILPSPEKLYLRIRNTSTIALRAAFVHGPYSLSVAAYPATFDPNTKFINARRYGVPQFEPMVKAGGSWECELTVPEDVRQTAGRGSVSASAGGMDASPSNSVTWIIEVASQVLFSTSASVGYEVVLGREHKSLSLSYATAVAAADNAQHHSHAAAGHYGKGSSNSHHHHHRHRSDQRGGIFSRAIHLVVEDTAALWNKPHIPGWSDVGKDRMRLAEELREEERKAAVAVGTTTAATATTTTTPLPVGTTGPRANYLKQDPPPNMTAPKRKKKKIHLVILTHGLHSNLSADMLFLKESIDAGAKKARADAKARRAQERQARQRREEEKLSAREHSLELTSNANAQDEGAPPSGKQPTSLLEHSRGQPETQEPVKPNGSQKIDNAMNEKAGLKPPSSVPTSNAEDEDDEDDDEEVVVKGYSGNATRTERGIKYLGKRLARYVLALTYPDQPYHPIISRGAGESLAHALRGNRESKSDKNSHKGDKGSPKSEKGSPKIKQANAPKASSAHDPLSHCNVLPDLDLPYQIASISFLGHSLGGLIQTYAVAYIQKHSPQFFDLIRPINFVALATPFLGLSNENPMYVKFALDFGLVGRTGQDLGLTWRPPTLARSGWSAIVSNLGETAHKKVLGESQPESKPLLRILPTGPAHTALRKFRNRTVYSNVVNDGIVPLRTSCLLFLDWQGLDRVEKARRGAGLVETVVALGWAELTGTSINHRRSLLAPPDDDDNNDNTANKANESSIAGKNEAKSTDGQPLTPLLGEEDKQHEVPQPSNQAIVEDGRQDIQAARPPPSHEVSSQASGAAAAGLSSPFSGFFSLFRNSEPQKPHPPSPKQKLIYSRSQTIPMGEETASLADSAVSTGSTASAKIESRVTTGAEFEESEGGLSAPPRTTVFESAHDIINPKLPDVPHIIDPTKRARTIFHDRVYHPEDIPPPLKKRHTKRLSLPQCSTKKGEKSENAPVSPGSTARAMITTAAHSPTGLSETTNGSMLSAKDNKDKSPGKAEPKAAKDTPEPEVTHMRVEEKIARAYHRDLSWRKVLVKLEPDAHNNIIVRRMFPNAYGWPVINHVVEAHFSDSASARLSVDREHCQERALDLTVPPNRHGGETNKDATPTSSSSDLRSRPLHSTHPQLTLNVNTKIPRHNPVESSEASDSVSDLPPLRKTSRQSKPDTSISASPSSVAASSFASALDSANWDHRDSMTWSDRDWHDSEPDSETGYLSPLSPSSPLHAYAQGVEFPPNGAQIEVPRQRPRTANVEARGQAPPSSSPPQGQADSIWNWTEAIVGKRHAKPGLAAPAAATQAELSTASGKVIPKTAEP